ncbi:TRAP transporter large permease subunit [Lutimaribacter sp. EGI FJ00015]|uniref:TRAP transporter large permease subunit n=1 Tax=Lutimaribacter degradans TaxID=2945989 RepID=A0ACC5ZZ12_9RHOB|nr:TRAP transporter large permease subunit [Lutimaribacter sp. EGI FJ00013]MCM2563603.1 TRAP transporter large permease subunit [Lutimaribacter sp. EGI FJ00013]MCO0614733.1 TRAP transporter large permease subunit [Lutimaribacter sp. EGI FJ00015]MCO0637403.1 TRAP transporter large permease subunit [Lutimaribacter sp. EGI FJ00014]
MDPVLIGEVLSGLMFFGVIGFLLMGFPVAFTLAGVSLLFAAVGMGFGVFDPSNFGSLPNRYIGFMTNEVLVAVPLFIFMGVTLERSQIAEQLLLTMGKLFGNMRGGLGISVVLVGAMLAASTGVVGATVVTMGLISLPAMLRAGYDPKLATGVICASGTLGQIIPPSTVLIFMGDMLSGINSQVQMAKGNFAPTPVSVGDLFAGALLPGLLLVSLYLVFIMFKAVTAPASCPATPVPAEEKAELLREVFVALIPPLLLIMAVLGSILGGIATPTEAASVGAVGAMVLAGLRRRLSFAVLQQTMIATATITSMVFVILLGASVFSIVFRMMGGDTLVHEFLSNLPGGTLAAVAVVMAIMFLLGFILDTFEIIFIVIPITAPVLLALDVDPVWLGVLVGLNLQTSFLTPPFGFALFYLRGVAPPDLPTSAIYKGILPFVVLQIIAISILFIFPQIVTYLPRLIAG